MRAAIVLPSGLLSAPSRRRGQSLRVVLTADKAGGGGSGGGGGGGGGAGGAGGAVKEI